MQATSRPDESTAILADLAAQFTARFPEDATRIGHGLALVLDGAVTPTLVARMWLVTSARDATVAYHTTRWSCSCPDHTQRERRCKHSWGVTLATALEDELRHQALVADQPISYELTPKAIDVVPIALELTPAGHAAASRQPWAPPTDGEWAMLADAVATTS